MRIQTKHQVIQTPFRNFENEIKVDGQAVEIWLGGVMTTHANDKRITRLKLDAVKSKLQAASTALEDWRKASDSWNDDTVWEDERASLKAKVDNWQVALRMLDRHKAAMDDVITAHSKAKVAAKTEFRKVRDSYRRWLVGRKVPDGLAKSAGDALREIAVPASSIGIQLEYERLGRVEVPAPIEVWEQPFLLDQPGKKPRETRDGLELFFSDLVEKNSNMVLGKRNAMLDYQKKNSVAQCMATARVSGGFDLGESVVGKASDHVKNLKMITWCKQTFTWSSSVVANAYRTCPYFLTQFTMNSIVVLLPPSVVTGLQDIDAWVETATNETLMQYPTVHLKEGSSLCVPMGFVSIVLTIPININYEAHSPTIPTPSRRGAEQFHHGFYGLNLFLSPSVVAAASVQARTLAYSWYVLQVGGWHDSINTEATVSFFEGQG